MPELSTGTRPPTQRTRGRRVAISGVVAGALILFGIRSTGRSLEETAAS